MAHIPERSVECNKACKTPKLLLARPGSAKAFEEAHALSVDLWHLGVGAPLQEQKMNHTPFSSQDPTGRNKLSESIFHYQYLHIDDQNAKAGRGIRELTACQVAVESLSVISGRSDT